jgi:LTXXQ motif family protein
MDAHASQGEDQGATVMSLIGSLRMQDHEVSKEAAMLKFIVSVLIVLVVGGTSLAYAQTTGVQAGPTLSPTDLKALTDARIALVKAALQLTPEQEKYWPALEEAIRARSMGRQQRLGALVNRLNQQGDADLSELLRQRADNMAQRSAELKKLVDAWQPLWQTLNPDQKRRMEILAISVLHVVRSAAEARQMDMEEDNED